MIDIEVDIIDYGVLFFMLFYDYVNWLGLDCVEKIVE